MTLLSMALHGTLALLLVGAAAHDYRTLTISNGWPVAMIALFVAAFPAGVVVAPLSSHLIHFGLSLIAGMTLFRLGWVGGGDAKLYMAAALWFPVEKGALLLMAVTLSGLLLAILHMGYRLAHSVQGGTQRSLRKGKIAYGVAIALGALVTMAPALGASTAP